MQNLGVLPNKIRNILTDLEGLRKRLLIPIQQRSMQTYTLEMENDCIGMFTLKKIQFGTSAEMHAHIFNIKNRKKGVASEIFTEILKMTFETFELKIIICEPTATNSAPNAFLQKMGLEIISTYETKAEEILRARIANRYEITREFYTRLLK